MTISKWGNSLGVRIPGVVAREAGIGLGTPVRITALRGRIVLEPIRYDLKNLVKGITSENKHKAIGVGQPVGNEVW